MSEVLCVNSANEILRRSGTLYSIPMEVSIAFQRRGKRAGKGGRTRKEFEGRLALIPPIRLGPTANPFVPNDKLSSDDMGPPQATFITTQTSLHRVILQMASCITPKVSIYEMSDVTTSGVKEMMMLSVCPNFLDIRE